jgi:hypothetical protein
MSDDDEWLDEQLLADDITSSPGWKRKARGGRTVNQAIAGIPRQGQLTTRVPIDLWRAIKDHVDARGVALGSYIREAVGERMAREGADPAIVQAIMTVGVRDAGN